MKRKQGKEVLWAENQMIEFLRPWKRIKQLKRLNWTKLLLKKQKQPFPISTEEHLRLSLFSKKRLQYRCFPINMAKFLRPAFFIEYLCSLILNAHSFCMILPQFALQFCILLLCERSAKGMRSFASFVEPFKTATLRGSHWQI